MKKLLLRLTVVIMLVALSLSLVGCGAFQAVNNNNYNNNGNDNNGGGLVNGPTQAQTLNKAEFGFYQDADRAEKSKIQVVAEVKRAVVAISISNEQGKPRGSGVVVDLKLKDKDGNRLDNDNDFYVITCHHVIDGKGTINVYLPDYENDNVGESDYNTKYAFQGTIGTNTYNTPVTLVGGDAVSDIALLKVTVADNEVAQTIPKVKFPAEGYQMMQGEDVIAIGNPGGDLPQTVSTGTISYINREALTEVGEMILTQMTAEIYPGSSGGGLFNLYGELIGITSAGRGVKTDSDGDITCYGGINYAIPYVIDKTQLDNGFKDISEQLLTTKTANNYGYVVGSGRVGEFGFQVGQITHTETVQITGVVAGSLASQTEMAVGDIIKKIVKGDASALESASRLTSMAQVTEVIKSLSVGEKVSLYLQSSTTGEFKTVTMTAAQLIFCNTGNFS